MNPITICSNGILKLLNNLKPGKANGPDGIPARFLRDFATSLTPSLTLLFQASLNQHKLPSDWKHARIVPIFKKGDRKSVTNYRPISLTSICSKLLEHIICSEISSHLEANNLIRENQHGFQRGKSCETQLIHTIDDIATDLDNGREIDALFLDFSKAFDKVPHKRLLLKLSLYGIPKQLLDWIEDFLKGRTQSVVIGDYSSNPCRVLSEVPQGTVLAPLLFICYVNDLATLVNSRIRLYADDILLYRTINTSDDNILLQDDLDTLLNWSKTWQMSFNPSKCIHLKIINKHFPMQTSYYLGEYIIQQSQSATYLGVKIDQRLKWSEHISSTISKANAANAFLKRNLSRCSSKVKKIVTYQW